MGSLICESNPDSYDMIHMIACSFHHRKVVLPIENKFRFSNSNDNSDNDSLMDYVVTSMQNIKKQIFGTAMENITKVQEQYKRTMIISIAEAK